MNVKNKINGELQFFEEEKIAETHKSKYFLTKTVWVVMYIYIYIYWVSK